MKEATLSKGRKAWLAGYLAKLAGIFVGCIALFFFLMVLAFCIPDEWVSEKQAESLAVFDENGNENEYPFTRERLIWEWAFSHSRGAQLDNRTDYSMILNVVPDTPKASVFYKAMSCNDYARYWHGYLVFLRPMVILFSYVQIRYIYMFLHLLLGMAVALRLQKNFGNRMVYLWTACLCVIYPIVIPFSLSYSSDFFVMMAAILIIDRAYSHKKNFSVEKRGVLFLILGMLTSYVDMQTAPFVTLGVPLIYLMLLEHASFGKDSLRQNMWNLINVSMTWAFGYAGCWSMKWVVASPILKYNVVQEGVANGLRRVAANGSAAGERALESVRAVALNLFALLPPGVTSEDWKWFLCIVFLILVVLIVLFVKFHVDKDNLKPLFPFLIVALYPYVWYVVLANQSRVHYIFTHRMQLLTLLGISIAYSKAVRIRRTSLKE